MKRFAKSIRHTCWIMYYAVTGLILFSLFAWSVGAVYYFSLLPRLFTAPMALVYLAATGWLSARFKQRARRRQLIAGAVTIVYVASLIQRPSNDRMWAADNAVLPNISISADSVRIRNFRHSVYRSESDSDVHYRDFAFQLTDLKQVWFVVQRFTALEGIAHNFLTFAITSDSGPKYFSVSVEIRREEGESFDPVQGLYRQFELIYVVADERDEIGSRAVFRPEDRVFLYPVNASVVQVQQLFVDIVSRMQSLQLHPEFYHSLGNNCTNNIVNHAYKFTPHPISSLDPRILAPGFADRLAFSKQLIGRPGETFLALQQRCRIDEIARQVGITDDFSADIRRSLR